MKFRPCSESLTEAIASLDRPRQRIYVTMAQL